MKRIVVGLCAAVIVAISSWALYAQVPSAISTASPIQMVQGYNALTAISSTGASAAQVTLTIPAPGPGLYNYICFLHFNYNQTNTTGTVQTLAVTTSTNFNSFALKYSTAAAINTNYDWSIPFGSPAAGCAKSSAPATATTFVSPAGATNGQFTWEATYFQAP